MNALLALPEATETGTTTTAGKETSATEDPPTLSPSSEEARNALLLQLATKTGTTTTTGKENATDTEDPSTFTSPLALEDSGMSQDHDHNYNILSEHSHSRRVDILTEGQHYLGISLLVYQYSHLRELCRMGHTRITFEEMDVNATAKTMTHNSWNQPTATRKEFCQRRTNLFGSIFSSVTTDLLQQQRQQQSHQYLHNKTKTASDIISITIDEIGLCTTCDHSSVDDDVDARHSVDVGLIVGATPEYEKRYDHLNFLLYL